MYSVFVECDRHRVVLTAQRGYTFLKAPRGESTKRKNQTERKREINEKDEFSREVESSRRLEASGNGEASRVRVE